MDKLWINFFIILTDVLAHDKPFKKTSDSFKYCYEQIIASISYDNFFKGNFHFDIV
jgi:hypothetical protein